MSRWRPWEWFGVCLVFFPLFPGMYHQIEWLVCMILGIRDLLLKLSVLGLWDF